MTERAGAVRRFLSELKHRKVFRTAGLYIVVAAGVVELADIVVPYTRLPDWTAGLVFAIALFAFPLALIVAWAYDVNPPSIERAGDTTTDAAGHDPGPAEVVPTDEGETEHPASDPGSLAVLPFDNLSGTEEVGTLASGLHGDLLTALSKVPGLTVIARRSVIGYAETDKRPAEIARELGVATLLEGAVQSAGGRVRLNVQLVDGRRETHRWAERYDRELSLENLFEIQADLARRITESLYEALGAELGAAGALPAAGPPTADLEAYRLYSRGRRWLDQRTAEALRQALGVFMEAVRRDPGYALAWAGVAEALALRRWYHYGGTDDDPPDVPDPDDAAARALDLDADLAEAHTAQAILHALRQHGPAARDALLRATEAGPGYADAHIWLSWTYLVLGDPGPALESAQRARRLNPLAPVVHVFTAEALLANARFLEARAAAHQATKLQPGYGLAHYMAALAEYHTDALEAAALSLDRTLELVSPDGTSPTVGQVRALRGIVDAASGDHRAARSRLEALTEREPDHPADRFASALLAIALGDLEEGRSALRGVGRWPALATEEVRFLYPAVLGPLREDGRLQEVLREVDASWGLTVG